MTGSQIEEFAESISGSTEAVGAVATSELDRVTVLGGGVDARLLAAICLAAGARVTLFSAYGTEIEQLKSGTGITLRGDGPVGTYQIDQESVPSIRTTAELDRAVDGADLIFLTGPVHKQRTYAMVLADHLRDGQVLVLAPGRSLGAAEALWLLRTGGCKADITLVEAQGLPYWPVAQGGTLTLSAADPVPAATLPSGRVGVLSGVSRFLTNVISVPSTVHSSFADGSALIELPAMLLGGPAVGDGKLDMPVGGVPLEENRNFRSLIGDSHIAVMRQLASEREIVASRFGVRDLPGLGGWLDKHAGSSRGSGSRPVPSADEARSLVRCGAIGSLVPMASAADVCGVAVPMTKAMIELASSVLGGDLAPAGRRLETIGINSDGIDSARRILDQIANGAP